MAHIFQRTGGKSVDLDSLQLPDGRKARGVDRDVLERELTALGVKFARGTGRDFMLMAYADWLAERPAVTEPRVMHRPGPSEPPEAA
jgi:hypothetical protein